MGCFVRGDKNSMGCYVRGDKNSMRCFVRGGKSLWDVLSGVAKNGMGFFVPGCFVQLPISALLEHPFFLDVSVAQLVASMSGVVLCGVVEVVGLNLDIAKYLQHLSAQLIHYIPPYK